ncbi:hypothetical protein PtA15_6A549 [Puccinia triticina]|uniref:Uncharacterized protein n=1 Tax=Puccinia triticina TaxID=208348 RepID=A0ABY7CMI5_9BASI|nr:uncharacterized protein PtA15_6A549 [Puccinia triticina]WAQ85920.1 hypothetical protein PtA15_6A549 [Puccinia triticina]WAR55814.1 hypothetical protein PtB15_6B557 [Puccinia triticina]
MFPAEKDLRVDFVDFVKGQKVVEKVSGRPAPAPKKPQKQRQGKKDLPPGQYPEYNRGSKLEHLDALRPQLAKALNQASNGQWNVANGWPSVTTVAKLKGLGATWRVQQNDLQVTPKEFCHKLDRLKSGELHRLLVAVGEGWFDLVGCDPELVDVLDVPDSQEAVQESQGQHCKGSSMARERPRSSNANSKAAKMKPTATVKPANAGNKQKQTAPENMSGSKKPRKSKAHYKSRAAIDTSDEKDTPDNSSKEEEEVPGILDSSNDNNSSDMPGEDESGDVEEDES